MSAPSLATPGGLVRAAGFEGELATLDFDITESRKNESATAILFGRAVARGASGGCKPPAGSTDIIIGLSRRAPVTAPAFASDNSTVNYPQNTLVPVLKDGFMYCIPTEDVRDGDQVLCSADGLGTLMGTKGGAASSTRLVVTGAVWQADVEATTNVISANTIGIVRISGPAEIATITT